MPTDPSWIGSGTGKYEKKEGGSPTALSLPRESPPITGTGERGRGDSGSEKEEAVTEKAAIGMLSVARTVEEERRLEFA